MSISSLSLQGKVAIVTGSRRGIGKAIALAFAEAGANVALCDIIVEPGGLEAVAEEIKQRGRRSLAVQTDLTLRSDVDNLIQKVMDEFGVIDILVNNAGTITRSTLVETTEEEWDKVMDTNLKGYFLCSQAAGRTMIERKQGSIINIASTAGMKAQTDCGCYSISKAGVVMLTRLMAAEIAQYNVRVNAISPGITKTEFNKSLWSNPEVLKNLRRAEVPIGRLAETGDIVGSALFLASDASSYITGNTILVDGGLLA